ncbi:MAG: hypothetical protein ACRC9L_09880 [Brevinema sp.]
MTFSQSVERKNNDIITAIVTDPFVTKMVDGTLDKKFFDYYISQDISYLYVFSQAAAYCASKASAEDMSFFIGMQQAALEEIENINRYYANGDDFILTPGQTTACLHYNHFVLSVAQQQPIEVAFAALYPCPWLYMHIGQLFGQNVKEGHPYKHWLESNGVPEYPVILKTYDALLNRYADQNPSLQEKMHEAARAAFFHERYFWQDAYTLNNFFEI